MVHQSDSLQTIWLDFLGAEVRFVDAAGVRTRVIEAGSGPPLILLHGGGGHAEAFAKNVVPLSREGLRVIAVDFLGHGLTDRPSAAIGRDQYVAHLLATMDALELDTATIAGESLGGWIAFWTALLHPERVAKLVSICGARLEVERDPESEAHVTEGRRRFKELNEAFLADPRPQTVRNRLAWLFFDPDESITDELVQLRWRLYQDENVQRTLQDGVGMKVVEGGEASRKRNAAFDGEILSQITQPTLMLWTSHNPSNTAATARRAASYMPNVRFTVMEKCGHWPQWEDPQRFNQDVADFVLGRRAVGEAVSGS